ncbi:MAG: flagellar filament capping protein FliD [Acidimicrobiia bacterium]|nr:flagellar filament capping protein FliD [Acidimicrobiia bacterium]MDH4309195.1 flagellar filament capping protein FliD [Acidimicrobiia bacterium]
MASPLFNIGGIASGLDTNSIVSQLMQIERIPLGQVQQRKTTFQQRNDAWSQISTRLSALRDKLKAIDEGSDWKSFAKATSSNESALGVSITGSPADQTVSFQISRLATAHQMASGTNLTASSDLVGAGTFSITIGGTQHDIVTDASTSLADLASQINGLDAGVNAAVVTVDTGSVKLMLTSEETGDASQFTVTNGLGTMGTFGTVEEGLDAQLTLGSGAGAITVERSSNVVDDLIEGVTLTLTATTTSPVTVAVNTDVDTAATKIEEFVTELNSALSTISSKTRTASEGGANAGPLSADSTARGLKLSLRSAISGVVAGLSGTYRTASSVGISLTRDGAVELDSTKLREALEADFDGVMQLFSRNFETSDSRVSVTRASSSDLDGTHAVVLTQAASRASITGGAYSAPVADASFDIVSGSKTATVNITAGSDISTTVQAINTALSNAGITALTATVDGGTITLADSRYGTSGNFTVTGDPFGLSGTHSGTDVAGTIGGIAASGTGRSLSGTGTLDGLILAITATPGQVTAGGGSLDLGTATVRSGLAATFDEFIDSVIGSGGLIDRATDRWDAQIKLAEDRMDQLEERLERREAALRRQFTALESAMGRMQSLAGQLASGLQSLPRPQ